MDHYYVNNEPRSGQEHEVHKEGCSHMPEIQNRSYLGFFDSCKEAVTKSKNHLYDNSDGCYFCCRECHTR